MAGAAQNREARIFLELRIRLGKLAEKELRATRRFDEARVYAIGAETEIGRRILFCGIGGHRK
jgi:hypothetical protein